MALTQAYMRQLVRSRLDDEDFEDEYLDQALNEAQWEILNGRNLTFLEKTTTRTLLTGTNTVDYPTDIAREPLSVRISATGLHSYDVTESYVDYANYQEQSYDQAYSTPSQPLYWTTFAGKMIFPVNADKDYTITIDYIKKASKVDGTTVTDFVIPEEYQELLKIGAYMRIAKREDDYDVSQQEKIDYTKQLADLVHAYARNRGPRNTHVMRAGR